MKKGVSVVLVGVVFLIILVSNLCLVFAQESEEDLPELEDYLQKEEAGVDEFMGLDGDSKNYVFENSESPYARNVMAEAIAIKIAKERLQQDLTSGALKLVADSWAPFILERIRKEGLSLPIEADDYQTLKKVVSENYGIDLSIYLETEIESVDGFDSSNLKWSEKGNVIGDGKVWLDLENLPRGVNKIKYDNGRFVLNLKSGGRIIIGEGVTDESGKVAILRSSGGEPLTLREMGFLFKEGEAVLDKRSVILRGNAKIIFGEFILTKNSLGSEGVLRTVSEGYYMAKNMVLTKEGIASVKIGRVETPVLIGDDATGLVREIGYEDLYKGEPGGTQGVGYYAEPVPPTSGSHGFYRFRFNEEGFVTHVKRKGTGKWGSETEWVSLNQDLKVIDSKLGGKSGTTYKIIEGLRERLLNPEKYPDSSYDFIKKSFESDPYLVKGNPKVDPSQGYSISNLLTGFNNWFSRKIGLLGEDMSGNLYTLDLADQFVRIDGNKIYAGGKNIQIEGLGNIGGLYVNSEEGKGKRIKFVNGEKVLYFDGPMIKWVGDQGKVGFEHDVFEIVNLGHAKNKEFVENPEGAKWKYEIGFDNKIGQKVFRRQDYVIAGHGPIGMEGAPPGASITVKFKREHLAQFKALTKGGKSREVLRTSLIDRIEKTPLEVKFDVPIPEGISVDATGIVDTALKGMKTNPQFQKFTKTQQDFIRQSFIDSMKGITVISNHITVSMSDDNKDLKPFVTIAIAGQSPRVIELKDVKTFRELKRLAFGNPYPEDFEDKKKRGYWPTHLINELWCTEMGQKPFVCRQK